MPDLVEGNDLGVLDDILGSSESEGLESGSEEGSADAGKPNDDLANTVSELVNAVKGMQNLTGKWGNEIGDIRNLLSNPAKPVAPEGVSNEIFEQLLADPTGFVKEQFNSHSQAAADKTQKLQETVRSSLLAKDPKADEYQSDMISIIAEDTGMDAAAVKDKFHSFGAATLVNVMERAKQGKQIAALTQLVDAMKRGDADLEGARAALAKTPTSGESFQTPSSADVPNIDLNKLSEADLDKLYTQRITNKQKS